MMSEAHTKAKNAEQVYRLYRNDPGAGVSNYRAAITGVAEELSGSPPERRAWRMPHGAPAATGHNQIVCER
jgi:hypothetical protein